MTNLINQENPQDFQVFSNTIHPDLANVVEGVVRLSGVQRLSGLIEKNAYHDSEDVLEHMAKVFANSQELLEFNFIKSSSLKKKYKTYLGRVVAKDGKYSRGDLLLLASGIHDVGKGVEKEKGITYLQVIDESGNTESTGHEHAGAQLVRNLLEHTDLISSEVEFVQSIVKLHDMFSEKFCSANLKKNMQQDIEIIQNTHPLYLELLLHIVADNHGAEVYKEWSDYFLHELLNSEFLLKD